jgi:hypothetical protein
MAPRREKMGSKMRKKSKMEKRLRWKRRQDGKKMARRKEAQDGNGSKRCKKKGGNMGIGAAWGKERIDREKEDEMGKGEMRKRRTMWGKRGRR